MSIELVIVIGVVAFMLLAASGLPVALSLAVGGAVGLILLQGTDVAGASLAQVPYSSVATFGIAVVPMYIFMGTLASHIEIPRQIFWLAYRYLSRVPGGLGIATVSAAAGFAAVTGSSVANAATIGRFSIPELRKYGYTAHLASGIVAVSGTLGVMIPPSIGLVLVGVISGESIGALLIAGIIPGLISALSYSVMIAFLASRSSSGIARWGDDRPLPEGSGEMSRAAVRSGLGGLLKAGILFGIVVGGIYGGVFTATESGAIGAFAALVMLLLHVRRPSTGKHTILSALWEGTSTTSMVLLIVMGGSIFTFFLASAQLPNMIIEAVDAIAVSPSVVVIMLMLAMVPLGMFLDPVSLTLIVVPLTYPVVTGLGFDGIWWGILTMKMIELGMITPPVGMNAFVVASTAGVKVETVFRGILPFYISDIAVVALLFAVPDIVLWLPSQMQ